MRTTQSSRAARSEARGAAVLLGPYGILLALAGIIPTGYALLASVRDAEGAFTGIENYRNIMSDFRFGQTFVHVAVTVVVFVPTIVVAAVALAILVHASGRWLSGATRFLLYVPGAFAGIANFVLWLFILDPTVSPVRSLWAALGFGTLAEVSQESHLPLVLTSILLFQGIGSWMLIVYGALNAIPEEITEAAQIDGAGALRRAWHITIPMIRPWIGYTALLNVAYALQLFLEPALLSQVTHGKVSNVWTPNQLSYTYAYTIGNIGAAAAMSVILLILTLAIGLIAVRVTNLFGDDQ